MAKLTIEVETDGELLHAAQRLQTLLTNLDFVKKFQIFGEPIGRDWVDPEPLASRKAPSDGLTFQERLDRAKNG